ncbi:MAG: hypothetical protein FD168_1121 [Desulfobulbaceae bacterium]|nr:MAG: hypothetical protein FD168_1121 [Desulfobulbaceae bacterium]
MPGGREMYASSPLEGRVKDFGEEQPAHGLKELLLPRPFLDELLLLQGFQVGVDIRRILFGYL